MPKEPTRLNMAPRFLFGMRVFVQRSNIQLVSQTEPKFLCKRMLSLTLWKYGHKQMHSYVLTWKGRRQTLFTTSPVSRKFNSIVLPYKTRLLFACTINITTRATAIAPCVPSQMFNIVTSRQMLRCKSTFHSNNNGIQAGAGSECNEGQDHIIYCRVITTICTAPRHCIQIGLNSNLTVAIAPLSYIVSAFNSHHAQAHELQVTPWTHLSHDTMSCST